MGKDLKGNELGKGIRQKSNGIYEARIMVNGKQKSITSTSLNLLRKEYEKLKNNKYDNINTDITLDKWFKEWFYNYKIHQIKKTSINSIVRKYRKFGSTLGGKRLGEIKNIDVQIIVNELVKKGNSNRYIKEILSTFCEILEAAKNNKYIDVNPGSMVYVEKSDKKEKDFRVLETDEEKVFLEVAKERWTYEAMYVLLNTGLRCSELCGLKFNDIDFKNKVIHINKQLTCNYIDGNKVLEFSSTKTVNSNRKVPMLCNVEAVLKQQIDKVKDRHKELGEVRWRGKGEFDNLVFTTSMGSPLTRYHLEKDINLIIKEMNVRSKMQAKIENKEFVEYKHCFPHALRHTFCSKCFKVGMQPKVVQALVGHKSLTTTMDIYTHIMSDTLEEEISKFNQNEFKKLNL